MSERDNSRLTDMGLFPWQQVNWQRFRQSVESKRLPHALLLTGLDGLGKSRFAVTLAASMLCHSPNENGQPCGRCKSCQLFNAGTHPNYTRIVPEEPGKAIRIDTIREFTSREVLTSQSGGHKVIIIEPADAMNGAAANSLLKTLEEPVASTLMILISSKPSRLPATIRSRCQTITFSIPDRVIAAEWLKSQLAGGDANMLLDVASGSPLLALQLSEGEMLAIRSGVLSDFSRVLARKCDPVDAAARWSKLDFSQLIQWLNGWLIDLIRLKMVPNLQTLINSDQKEHLQQLSLTLELKELYGLFDKLLDAARAVGSQLNTQLLLEDLLLTGINAKSRKAG